MRRHASPGRALLALVGLACSPGGGGRDPAQEATIQPPAGTPAGAPAPAFSLPEQPALVARLEVGRCGQDGASVADRSGVLGPQESICALISGPKLATGAAVWRLRLAGATVPAVEREQAIALASGPAVATRFDPPGAWPLGAYRVILVEGTRELAAWELEIRAEGAPAAGQ